MQVRGVDGTTGIGQNHIAGAQEMRNTIIEPPVAQRRPRLRLIRLPCACLLYTSDAADERSSVDLGGRRIIKKKTNRNTLWAMHAPVDYRRIHLDTHCARLKEMQQDRYTVVRR